MLQTFAVLTNPWAETPVTANDVPLPTLPIDPAACSPVGLILIPTLGMAVPKVPAAETPVGLMVLSTLGVAVPTAPAAEIPVAETV